MATDQQGIMSLPQGGQEAAPQLSIDDSYDAISGALGDTNPEASGQIQQLMAQLTPMLDQLTDEQLDLVIALFQYLHDHPEKYAETVQQAISQGVFEEGMLPEKYDPELIAALGMVFLQAKRERQTGNAREMQAQMPQPPATMARGGIAEAARMVANQGRYGDTTLAHITKGEARMLKKRGGSGTINPSTGLPEYWNPLKDLVDAGKSVVGAVRGVTSGIADAVKPVLSSTVGRILVTAALATFLGPGAFGITGAGLVGSTAAAAGLASGIVTGVMGGSLKDILKAGATSYFSAALAPGVGKEVGSAVGVTSAAGQAALGAGVVGAGIGKLTGQSLQDAIKTGLTQGAISGAINLASTPAPTGPGGPGAPVVEGKPVSVEDIRNQIAQGGGQQSTAPTTPPPAAATSAPGIAAQGPQTAGAMGPQQGIASLGPEFNQYETTLSKVQNLGQDTYQGAKDLYNRYLSPSGIAEQGAKDATVKANEAYRQTLADTGSQTLAEKAYQTAYDAAKPGVFAKYGPLIGAGLGAAALAGGFKPTPLPPSELANKLAGTPGEDLIRDNPRQYLIQNLPGVKYDENGYIIGSERWTPRGSIETTRQTMPGTTSTFEPTYYTPPPGALGQQNRIAQPYNNANMYGNLFQPIDFLGRPRYAADGGYMQAADGGPMNPAAPPSEGGMGDGGIASLQPTVHMSWGGDVFDAVRQALSGTKGLILSKTEPVRNALKEFTTPDLPSPNPGGVSTDPVPNPINPVAPTPTVGSSPPNMGSGPGISSLAARLYPSLYNEQFKQQLLNPNLAGLASFAEGGYPRRTGQISGPGTEKSDSIPAMLSDGEFVMTAKAVRGAGKGDRRAGAKKMYALMHQLERNASRG